MQEARIEHQSAEPRRAESIRIAQRYVPVVVVRGQSGRRQRCLLHQGIAREVAVFGSAQEPLRLRRLRPIEAQRTDVVAEGDGNVFGNSNGWDAWDQAIRSQLRQGIELRGARGAVRNAGIFMDMFK